MRTRRAAPAVLVVAVVFAACGVPLDDGVRRTDAVDVPFGLLDSPVATTTTTTTEGPAAAVDTFGTYFVRNGQLTEVITRREAPITVDSAMAVLLGGPGADDARNGLRTALVGDQLVRSAKTAGGAAIVDLGENFGALAPREQLLGIGQIVMTLTTLRGVGSVSFSVAGKFADVRVGDGSLVQRPVSREDYASLLLRS